jgi:hypothetical protein
MMEYYSVADLKMLFPGRESGLLRRSTINIDFSDPL